MFLKWVPYYTHSHRIHIATCTEIVILKRVSFYYTLSLYTHCHMDRNCVFKTSSLLHTHTHCIPISTWTEIMFLKTSAVDYTPLCVRHLSWIHNFSSIVKSCFQDTISLFLKLSKYTLNSIACWGMAKVKEFLLGTWPINH